MFKIFFAIQKNILNIDNQAIIFYLGVPAQWWLRRVVVVPSRAPLYLFSKHLVEIPYAKKDAVPPAHTGKVLRRKY